MNGTLRSSFEDEFSASLRISSAEDRSCLAKLQSSVDGFKDDIQKILDFRDASELAARQAPELARQLQMDQMVDTQRRAVLHVHQLAREPGSRTGLATCPELIHSLTQVLHKSTVQDIQDETALSLQHLSKVYSAAMEIVRYIPVKTLLQMLGHPSDVLVFTAVSILHQLIYHSPSEIKHEMRELNAPIRLAVLFDEPIEQERQQQIGYHRILIVAADTLRVLAFEHQETKAILLSTSLNRRLVQLLGYDANKVKLNYSLARLMKVLSVCPMNKAALVAAGAMPALGQLLHSAHPSLILEALWTLRNLSDQAYHLQGLRDLMRRLIDLLASREEHVATCAAGCLCNLTCQNTENKALVVEYGGVESLCETLVENISREEVTEPVCSALRHVTHQHEHAEAAVYQIRNSLALEMLVGLLKSGTLGTGSQPIPPHLFPLLKAVVGLIRNLAVDHECRRAMRRHQVMPALIRLVEQISKLYQDSIGARTSIVSVSSDTEELYVEGVRVDEMVELSLVALQCMAKDQPVREELMHRPGLLTIAVQVMYSKSESLQRASVGFLNEMSVSSRAGKVIEHEGAIPRLTELIQSSNQAIAAYSAAILHRGAYNKPEEYRRRLNMELRQSLFDGGVLNEEALARATEPMETRSIDQKQFYTNDSLFSGGNDRGFGGSTAMERSTLGLIPSGTFDSLPRRANADVRSRSPSNASNYMNLGRLPVPGAFS